MLSGIPDRQQSQAWGAAFSSLTILCCCKQDHLRLRCAPPPRSAKAQAVLAAAGNCRESFAGCKG